MLDWDDLRVFLVAYREGSIGRAAEVLGVSGSTVSRRLAALEDALGQALFVRSPEGLMPTDAACHAFAAAEDAERCLTRVEGLLSAHDRPRGLVRVTLSSEMLHNVVLPHWPGFAERYPEITVDFLESPHLADLERWEADIAIRTVMPSSTEQLVVTRVRDSFSRLFGARSLLQRQGLDVSDTAALADLADAGWSAWPWIDWMPAFEQLPLARARQQLYPNARVVLRFESLESIRMAACAGLGLAFLPNYFGLMSPTLVPLPSLLSDKPHPVYMVCHTAIRHTARTHAVWTYLHDLLRGNDDDQLAMGRAAKTQAYGLVFP